MTASADGPGTPGTSAPATDPEAGRLSGVGRDAAHSTRPDPSTTPPAIFVPPMSIAATRPTSCVDVPMASPSPRPDLGAMVSLNRLSVKYQGRRLPPAPR